jgi:hypothetical protein
MTDETTGVTAESVAAVPTEAVQQQDVQPTVSDKELNFKTLREKAETLERQNEWLQMQNMQLQQTQNKPPPEETSLNDDDLMTVGEFRKLRAKEKASQQSYEEKIRDLEMRSRHSDYEEVIKTYLPDVLQEDPDLAVAIKDNPQMHKLAYKLAQASPKYHQERLAKQNSGVINKMVENASRPQPANARKSATIGDPDARLASMTDDDLMRVFQMAKARS